MKKIYKLVAILMLSALVSGCTDYFDVDNPNAVLEEDFWQSGDDAYKGLMATYSGLQGKGANGGSSSTKMPVRADTGRPNNWNQGDKALQQLSFNDNTDIVKDKWGDLYTGIFRANQVIQNLPNIEMDSLDKTLYMAEARFLRGTFYYWLYSTYNNGSVIIHLNVPNTDDFSKPPSSKEEVLAVILDDLLFAQKNLPETWEDDMRGRATWGACTGMLGQVYINEHNYVSAKEEFKKIIDSGLYTLTPEISWNFDLDHEFNTESIFEVVFSAVQKPGSSGYGQDGPSGSEGTTRAKTLAPGNAGGYRSVMPSYWVTMLLKEDKMDPTDPRNNDRKYSLRAEASIAMADDGTIFYQIPVEKSGFSNGEASYVRKFQNHWNDNDGIGDVANSGINERIIRLADVYLLYAECLLEVNGNGGISESVRLINEVRARSGLTQLDPINYNSTTLMEHIMWNERPKEFLFEGHDTRWIDLRRWGKIKEHYDHLADMNFVLLNKILKYATEDQINSGQVPILKEYVEAAAVYSPLAHDYFPIPVTETVTNPNTSDN
ncbi:RagB/SusD family nutrient uptake outer membrane protein [Flammeovirga pectinis]|uniref:RagB/SusD family nutrient uptake outer membrane protein n=1 Tax=Flammeovirga pectinis TaxID=2494373 RepID=A0A3Q9FN63_9BACT|nr:RagB/SusD family nutrient uptake outer membrane protein [Flammeovirga pectinis]AZQ63990.1 RagB/SusD family nutrient uptake outer membrane protein [Flammeovirga pectinis]